MAHPSRKADHGHERARTDAGLTGDKIAVGDPAAAPVHTDAETAGTPTSAQFAAESAQRQASIAQQARSKRGMAPFGSRRQPFGSRNAVAVLLTVGSLIVLVAAGVIAAFISMSSL